MNFNLRELNDPQHQSSNCGEAGGERETMNWLRARFHANYDDSRPVKWPPPGPFWESGLAVDESYSVVIAYVRSKEQIKEYWPEATEIEVTEEIEPTFSDRFRCPKYWDQKTQSVKLAEKGRG